MELKVKILVLLSALIMLLTVGLIVLDNAGKKKNKPEPIISESLQEETVEETEIDIQTPKTVYDEIDVDILSEIVSFNNKTGYPIWYLCTIIETESEFNKNAKSKAGASNGRGLMQISDITLRDYNNWHEVQYTAEDMYDIHDNLEVGTWYLSTLENKYLKNYSLSYSDLYIAYNVGPTAFKNQYDSLSQGWYYSTKASEWREYHAKERYLSKEKKYLNS